MQISKNALPCGRALALRGHTAKGCFLLHIMVTHLEKARKKIVYKHDFSFFKMKVRVLSYD